MRARGRGGIRDSWHTQKSRGLIVERSTMVPLPPETSAHSLCCYSCCCSCVVIVATLVSVLVLVSLLLLLLLLLCVVYSMSSFNVLQVAIFFNPSCPANRITML